MSEKAPTPAVTHQRITFNETLSGERDTFIRGQTYNVEEPLATEYLSKGLASEPVDLVPAAQVAKTSGSSEPETPDAKAAKAAAAKAAKAAAKK